jgi:uncharacterized membrane protein YraQ (UPF0718 family)/copper chaperone CopZ
LDYLATFWHELLAVTYEMSPFLLLGFIVAGFLSAFVSSNFVESHLGRGRLAPFKAAFLGVPLPLCSCGVIPVAASLRRHGASRASTVSFLISTPQTGVDSILVTYSLLGGPVAIFRPIAAFISGIVGGFVELVGDKKDGDTVGTVSESSAAPLKERLKKGLEYGMVDLPYDIGRPLVVGLLVAAAISATFPDDLLAGTLGSGLAGIFLMLLFSVPVYVCATASVPMAAALIAKGLSPGAAIVFLMAGPATNAATIGTVWKTMGRRTAALYLATVVVTSVTAGLLLNEIISPEAVKSLHHDHHHGAGWLETGSAIVLVLMLVYSQIRVRTAPAKDLSVVKGGIHFTVAGMTCKNCVASVENTTRSISGVENAVADLTTGAMVVEGASIQTNQIIQALDQMGYQAKVVEEPGEETC